MKPSNPEFTNNLRPDGKYDIFVDGVLVATVPTYGAVVVTTQLIRKNMSN